MQIERIARRLGWGVIGALVVALLAALATVVYGGPLDPPSGVTTSTQTQQNLIFQPVNCSGFPITINAPGSYKLAQNITMPASCAQDGISVSGFGVTLDLNGFALTGVSGSGRGIYITSKDVVIRDGTIRSWGNDGVEISTGAVNVAVSNTIVTENAGNGIAVSGTVSGWSVTNDTVQGNGGDGIVSFSGAAEGDVAGNIFRDNNNSGILTEGNDVTIEANTSSGNGQEGIGVLGSRDRVIDNHATNNRLAMGCSEISIASGAVGTLVENNTAETTLASGCGAIRLDGSYIVAHGNVGNDTSGGAGFYAAGCTSCDVGTIGTASLSTSSWANISN